MVPAAHYLCGGVLVDEFGNSSLAGLMAIGETACTGLHGANRLASNSLLEAVVFAEKAAAYCRQGLEETKGRGQGTEISFDSLQPTVELDEHILVNHNWDVLRRTMWNYVGIVRNSKRLELARERIILITREVETLYESHKITRNMAELRNIAQVSLLIIESALLRKESRGLHYTTDYPDTDNDQLHWIVLSRQPNSQSWKFSVERQQFSHAG